MIARPDLIMQVPISQIEPLFALDAVRVDRYIAMLKDGKTPPPIWRPEWRTHFVGDCAMDHIA
jgi:hypothetical protein